MRSFFRKFKNLYRQYQYERLVVGKFLKWTGQHTFEGATVQIRMDTLEGIWQKRGNGFVKISKKESNVVFQMYTPPYQPHKNIDPQKPAPVTLFQSDFCVIEEFPHEPLLRHGLTIKEKEVALHIVRENLNSFLSNGAPMQEYSFKNTPAKFQEAATVDVALWIDGQLRGSIIHSEKSLLSALITGSVRSARDGRFRPLEHRELDRLRIEINILSDLHIPFPDIQYLSKVIMTEKGYVVRHQEKTGWFLPTVFNVTRFSRFAEFLERLAFEKAKIQRTELQHATFSMFEIENFIENANRTSVCELNGALIKSPRTMERDADLGYLTISLAEWLCRLQTSEGFIPQQADPYTRTTSKADWVRMAFTAFALGTYGKISNINRYGHAAQLTAKYIGSVADDILTLSRENRILINTYLGRLALLQNRNSDAQNHYEKIKDHISQNELQSNITALQVASFFRELNIDGEDIEHTEAITENVWGKWRTKALNGAEISFAQFAELLPNLFYLAQRQDTQSRKFREKYEELRKWYLENQFSNGAFPNTTYSAFTYTRGTAKICEALAVDRECLGATLKALQWVAQFQYTEDTLFSVVPEFQDKVLGSVMHDAVNHTAWIDSAGHVLVCAALLSRNTDSAEDHFSF